MCTGSMKARLIFNPSDECKAVLGYVMHVILELTKTLDVDTLLVN